MDVRNLLLLKINPKIDKTINNNIRIFILILFSFLIQLIKD